MGHAEWATNYTSVDRDGTPRFTAEFRFVSEDNMLAFENGPFAFAPRYGGFDGWTLARMGPGLRSLGPPPLPWSRDRLGPAVDVTAASAWAMVPGADGGPPVLHAFANASSAASFVQGLPGYNGFDIIFLGEGAPFPPARFAFRQRHHHRAAA